MSCLSGLPGSQANYLHVDLVRKWWITKPGHAKEQLHYTVAQSRQAKLDMQMDCTTLLPSPGKQSWTCKRITACIAMLQGPGKKNRTWKKNNCSAWVARSWQAKTGHAKRFALQCCKYLEEKFDNCTALLPGVCKQNRSCLRTIALYVAVSRKTQARHAKEKLHRIVAWSRLEKPDLQKN